jgi:molecular chaperone GrpE
MKRNDNHNQHNDKEREEALNQEQLQAEEAENTEAAETEEAPELSEVDQLKADLAGKEEELAKEKKEYLFLMAEFDNFRKRTLRERAELIKNASEKVLQGLLPIVDDFERGLDAIKDAEDAASVKEGMSLIYNKLIKYLADNGVKAMESTGADFDSEIHEAIAMIPADNETPAGKVKDTVQKGYLLNDKVLRHAKVVVAQ